MVMNFNMRALEQEGGRRLQLPQTLTDQVLLFRLRPALQHTHHLYDA